MDNPFFERPILNSPHEYPSRHWELDDQGQPTQKIIERRRPGFLHDADSKATAARSRAEQQQIIFDEGASLSTERQQYDPTPVINELLRHVDQWRNWPNPNEWMVTPETTRLLQHWRHYGVQ